MQHEFDEDTRSSRVGQAIVEAATKKETLIDVMPQQFGWGEYVDTPAYKLRDVAVRARMDSSVTAWPGPQKNVHFWVVLENGKAVGFNESPSRGWSFPVITVGKK